MLDKNLKLLSECCYDLHLQPEVRLIEVNGFRWNLEYEQNPNYLDFAKNMIKLERMLQEKTGRPIDLRLDSEADKNKREKRNFLWKEKV